MEAVKDFPSPNAKIKLKEGKAFVFKMDIFKRLVYLIAPDGATNGPVAVTLEDMNELLEMNKRGEYPHSLTEFALEEGPDEVDETYSNVVGQDSLTASMSSAADVKTPGRNRSGNKNKSGGARRRRLKTVHSKEEARWQQAGKPRKKRRRPPRNANAKADKS